MEATNLAIDHNIPSSGPELFILRLKGNERFSFTSLATSIFGIWVHWSGNRSSPHYINAKKCPGCMEEQPKRWKGFLHAFCYEKKQEVFLELTPASASSLNRQVNAGRSTRGLRFTVLRTKGDNGRLVVQVEPYAPIAGEETLPLEKSPLGSLIKLWGLGGKAPDNATYRHVAPPFQERFNGVPIGTGER